MEPNPVDRFKAWLDDAVAAGLPEPTAMSLATASADGAPSNRMVLLKGVDDAGFVFFTNFNSTKGRDLKDNPRAAIVFHWQPLGRQVRVTGPVRKVTAAESDAYFASRPVGSKLSAWASAQSEPVLQREDLEQKVAELRERWPDGVVPRPPHWGGYRLRPEVVEFWTHRDDRLHDRIRYRRKRYGWAVDRVAP
ncbi:MAG: pyridoxamine 5'-phosphate oxidase [Actinobacteria bacterium]|nr:pyridoxamine 5'-phosphate oxidase [Actinomycetota bacterium]